MEHKHQWVWMRGHNMIAVAPIYIGQPPEVGVFYCATAACPAALWAKVRYDEAGQTYVLAEGQPVGDPP